MVLLWPYVRVLAKPFSLSPFAPGQRQQERSNLPYLVLFLDFDSLSISITVNQAPWLCALAPSLLALWLAQLFALPA